MSDLQGMTALITGGGSGIGKAAALRLSQAGARIGLLGQTLKELKEVQAEIEGIGGQAVSLEADVSSPQEMQAAVEKLVDAFDTIDTVFANAGINGVWAPLEDLDPDEWDKTLAVNLKGTFLSVKYSLPYLKRRGGSVIVTSSVNGTRIFSNTGATAYSCSKAAQVAFSKMAALELAKHRIRVNVICPGAIETRIGDSTEKRNLEDEAEPVIFPEGEVPLTDGEPGESEQVAELVYFLASSASSHISGTEIWIDGAQSLLKG